MSTYANKKVKKKNRVRNPFYNVIGTIAKRSSNYMSVSNGPSSIG